MIKHPLSATPLVHQWWILKARPSKKTQTSSWNGRIGSLRLRNSRPLLPHGAAAMRDKELPDKLLCFICVIVTLNRCNNEKHHCSISLGHVRAHYNCKWPHCVTFLSIFNICWDLIDRKLLPIFLSLSRTANLITSIPITARTGP